MQIQFTWISFKNQMKKQKQFVQMEKQKSAESSQQRGNSSTSVNVNIYT